MYQLDQQVWLTRLKGKKLRDGNRKLLRNVCIYETTKVAEKFVKYEIFFSRKLKKKITLQSTYIKPFQLCKTACTSSRILSFFRAWNAGRAGRWTRWRATSLPRLAERGRLSVWRYTPRCTTLHRCTALSHCRVSRNTNKQTNKQINKQTQIQAYKQTNKIHL